MLEYRADAEPIVYELSVSGTTPLVCVVDATRLPVRLPVNPEDAPSFTGVGTGTLENPDYGSDIWQIKSFIESEGADWADYSSKFETYGSSDWFTKEELLRGAADIDIDQIYDVWGEYDPDTGAGTGTFGTLGKGWAQFSGDLYEDWYGTGDGPDGIPNSGDEFIGGQQFLRDQRAGAEDVWGLMSDEWDPNTLTGGDIGRREWEAGEGWDFTKTELTRLRREALTGWETTNYYCLSDGNYS